MTEEIIRRFVCECLGLQWNTPADASVRQLAKDDRFDWQSVRQLLDAEELAPLIYDLTRERGILPPDLNRDLSASYYATGAQNTLQLKDMIQVLERLASAGVAVALLKGAALVETLHQSVAARPMEDIDLLVRPESLPVAVDILSVFSGSSPSSANHVQPFADRERQISFKCVKSNTVFDLHWQAFDSPFHRHELFTQWLWESSVPAQIGSVPAVSLSPEAMILHLCGHYAIDAGRKELLWLYDIASTVSTSRRLLDWDLLIARAQMYGLLLAVKRVFSSIDENWKDLIPLAVLEKLERARPSRADKAFDDWTASRDRAAVRLFGANLESLTSWGERLRFVLSSIFPSIPYMRHRYSISNPFLALLTYPYRWLLSLHRLVLR